MDSSPEQMAPFLIRHAPTFHPNLAVAILISCSQQSFGLSHSQLPRPRREILKEPSDVCTKSISDKFNRVSS